MNLDSNTSAELLFIINQLPYSYNNKIPNELKEQINNNYNKEIYKSFIPDKPYFKQNISEETLSIFYDIVNNYLI